ncbi:MAG TPA: hypothetical protein VLD67_08360 [Vicinamibacterales bacterium]|nr:hypothetical protein [Vicinamibacterales bacterium]
MEPRRQVVEHVGRIAGARVLARGHRRCTRDPEEEHVLLIEADVGGLEIVKRAHEEAGRRDQHERHRHLRDQQRTLEGARAAGCGYRTVLHRGIGIDARRPPRSHQANERGDHEHDDRKVRIHSQVQRGLQDERRVSPMNPGKPAVLCLPRRQQTSSVAARRDKHGHLGAPCRAPGKQQAGEVHRHNEEQDASNRR